MPVHSARFWSPSIVATAILLSLACGGGGDGGGNPSAPTPPAPTPTRIVLAPAAVDTLNPGETHQLSATVYGNADTVLVAYPVTYMSSNTAIATVTSTGMVTAGQRMGTATITAQGGSDTSHTVTSNAVTIVVYNLALIGVPAQVTLAQDLPTTLTVGASIPVSVKVTDIFNTPVTGTTVAFDVQSGNGTVAPFSATTDANGIASTTWTVGTNTSLVNSLVASAGTVQTSITCSPSPGPIVAIAMQTSFAQRAVGEGVTLYVRARDAYGNLFDPVSAQFVSRNPSVLSLTSTTPPASALFMAQAAGQAYVVATVNGFADSSLIGVYPSNGIIVSIAPPSLTLPVATTFSADVLVTAGSLVPPIGSITATVTWDPTVLTYVSDDLSNGSGVPGAVTVNKTNVANGSLTIAAASGTSLGEGIRMITFAAVSTPGRHGTLGVTVSDISSSTFTDLLPVTQSVTLPVSTR